MMTATAMTARSSSTAPQTAVAGGGVDPDRPVELRVAVQHARKQTNTPVDLVIRGRRRSATCDSSRAATPRGSPARVWLPGQCPRITGARRSTAASIAGSVISP